MRSPVSVTLRHAAAGDAAALRRLAERDSATLGPGPYLVAIRDGELEAAISLTDGDVVADPFRHTADLQALLRCAARRRVGPVLSGRTRRRAPLLRERLA